MLRTAADRAKTIRNPFWIASVSRVWLCRMLPPGNIPLIRAVDVRPHVPPNPPPQPCLPHAYRRPRLPPPPRPDRPNPTPLAHRLAPPALPPPRPLRNSPHIL